MNFDEAFDRLLGHEGSYSFHRSDRGGETMWGITSDVARAQCYRGAMAALSQATAKQIYHDAYWLPVRADKLPAAIRFDVFDGAVNSGVTQSIKWLQRSLEVADDGFIGPVTLAACDTIPGDTLRLRFNGQRLNHLCNLQGWPSFGKGWTRRVATNLLFP